MTAAESAACRAAVLAIGDWIVDEQSPMPTRAEIAAAVRLTAAARAGSFGRGSGATVRRRAVHRRAKPHAGDATQCRRDLSAYLVASGDRCPDL